MKIDKITAKEFKDYMIKYPDLYKKIAQIIYKNLDNNKNPKILDLGSGPALINSEILKIIPNSIIISLDNSLNMLKNANKHHKKANKKNFNGILATSEKIPLKDNSIDLLVSRFSISYWKKPKKAILEIKRVLKPGGKFILEGLNKKFPKWKLFLIKIHMILKLAGYNVIKYHIDAYQNAYEIDTIYQILQKNGFKNIKKEGNKKDWKFTLISEKL